MHRYVIPKYLVLSPGLYTSRPAMQICCCFLRSRSCIMLCVLMLKPFKQGFPVLRKTHKSEPGIRLKKDNQPPPKTKEVPQPGGPRKTTRESFIWGSRFLRMNASHIALAKRKKTRRTGPAWCAAICFGRSSKLSRWHRPR